MANVVGLHHPAIVVPDLERAVAFYSAFAGYETVRENRWDADSPLNQIIGLTNSSAGFCMLQGPFGFLELFEFDQPRSDLRPETLHANDYGIRHLCFQVEDVHAALEQVVALGGRRMNDPVTNDKGITAVYCRDPFGNLLELLAPAGALPGLAD